MTTSSTKKVVRLDKFMEMVTEEERKVLEKEYDFISWEGPEGWKEPKVSQIIDASDKVADKYGVEIVFSSLGGLAWYWVRLARRKEREEE